MPPSEGGIRVFGPYSWMAYRGGAAGRSAPAVQFFQQLQVDLAFGKVRIPLAQLTPDHSNDQFPRVQHQSYALSWAQTCQELHLHPIHGVKAKLGELSAPHRGLPTSIQSTAADSVLVSVLPGMTVAGAVA